MNNKINIKALCINPKKNISFINDVIKPSSIDDFQIKWISSSVCNSERRRYNLTKSATNKKPFIGGHEAVGIINDDSSYISKKYALLPHSNCLTRRDEDKCLACENGHENLCSKMLHAGLDSGTPSGFSNYMFVNKNQLVDVTDISDNESIFLEPLACVIRSWDLSNINVSKKTNQIAIIGGGPIGCLHALYINRLNPKNKITIIENSVIRLKTLREIFKSFPNIDVTDEKINKNYNVSVMACSNTSGYKTAYEILEDKGVLILFSGFNDIDFKQDDFYPEIIHRNEYKHYTDKKIIIGSSGYSINEIIKSKRILTDFKPSQAIITGKVDGIDSNVLFLKDGSKRVYDEPVIIKDIKGELEDQIKIQYFNNGGSEENFKF
tara:strand:- start:489 stop:1628 length:1140 start_codon:yes stop_codon:yes gene_type:complete